MTQPDVAYCGGGNRRILVTVEAVIFGPSDVPHQPLTSGIRLFGSTYRYQRNQRAACGGVAKMQYK